MHAAFERDADLLEFAAGQSVVLATPMTLLALLRAVSSGWTQLSTAKNAEAIRDAALELCDRLALMLGLTQGLMGVLTPYATGPAPVYASSGYLPSADFWRLGTLFGYQHFNIQPDIMTLGKFTYTYDFRYFDFW